MQKFSLFIGEEKGFKLYLIYPTFDLRNLFYDPEYLGMTEAIIVNSLAIQDDSTLFSLLESNSLYVYDFEHKNILWPYALDISLGKNSGTRLLEKLGYPILKYVPSMLTQKNCPYRN